MATRGNSLEELFSSIWWNGPLWLTNPIKQWPHPELMIDETVKRESEREVKGTRILYEAKLFSEEGPSDDRVKRPDLSDIDEKRFHLQCLRCRLCLENGLPSRFHLSSWELTTSGHFTSSSLYRHQKQILRSFPRKYGYACSRVLLSELFIILSLLKA